MRLIKQNRVYKRDELLEIITQRCLNNLTNHGLRAVSNLYLGRDIHKAWQRASSSKFYSRKDNNFEKQKEEVVENSNHRKIQPIPKHQKPENLRGQLEEIKAEKATI